MTYDIGEDPYMDPKTGILRNKIGAKTQAKLDKAEAEITYIVIATLTQGTDVSRLSYDTQLIRDIHKEIFRDIYSWAGKFREHDISKGEMYFAHADYIESALNEIVAKMRTDKDILNGDLDCFTHALAYYYGELNAVHPFREGNGRTIRTFLTLLAHRYGYDIQWAKMEAEENIDASIAAMKDDSNLLYLMLRNLVVPMF